MNIKNTFIMHICWTRSAVEHVCILYRNYIWDILYINYKQNIYDIYVPYMFNIYFTYIYF